MNLSAGLLVAVVRGEYKSDKPANIISKIKAVSPTKLSRQEYGELKADIVKPIILAYSMYYICLIFYLYLLFIYYFCHR